MKRLQRTQMDGTPEPEAKVPDSEPVDAQLLPGDLRTLFERAPIGLARLSLEGAVVSANDSLGVILGTEPSQIVGKRMKELTYSEDHEVISDALTRLASGSVAAYRGENRLVDAEGNSVWVDLYVVPVQADGAVDHLIAYVLGVADRRRFEEQLRHVATHDAMTGLRNRRGFEEELDRHEDRTQRYGPSGALLLLDIDDFHEVNEEYGYSIGDALLMSVADVVRSQVRTTDVAARLGADEFAVLLPYAGQEEAVEVGQRLVDSFRSHELSMGEGRTRAVTASVGAAMFDDSTPGADTVLSSAEEAARSAKLSGGSQIAVFDASAAASVAGQSRLDWVEKIRRSLDEDNFLIHAQPVLNLHTEKISRYELFIRMLDGDRIVSPGEFLHVAERHGLIKEIDAYVTNHAIDLLASDTYPAEMQVEVNLSGVSLAGGELLALLETRFGETGVEPRRLVFEVNEPAAAANLAVVREFAEKVAALGCQFALDDFGTGFGNFAYLKHLPFDFVKIDGEFVEGVMTSATDRLIIESTVSIAEGLGKETVAEFVADQHTLHFLARLGVDYAQGYHVGRPVPLEELLGSFSES